LNQLPAVKTFLTQGEALWYAHVDVVWVNGQEPVLYVNRTGQDQEEMYELSSYIMKPAIHKLMKDLGFELLPKAERDAATRKAVRQHEWKERQQFMRKAYYQKQVKVIKSFNEVVMNGQGFFHAIQQCRLGREEPLYLIDAYDRFNAIERYVATGKITEGTDLKAAEDLKASLEAEYLS